MAINFDAALGIHAEALRVRSQRAEMLATNLANADTPNFKARDIDFQAALKAANADQQSGKLERTHQQHFQVNANSVDNPAIQYRTVIQDSLDGNTVDEQVEQAQFMQNAVHYQATLEFLGGKFQSLTKALRGE
ncbi:Flagellar basal-body rod protein FlgB [Methylophaga frappieri]|uniref:Flagellar basal body rod protein FlgB n=1 Tax=Methylophaga frappieri (strain ATCC BAA-2434 / DSM 25690 / JAM7) TaxID=754477 RepID=I1YKL7_METFJ|nr:flagellar basal body rod protein FlgB [Methylophaga frappieri]AFJ03460.1 Flagellar basal-body rod protein FlgB [Methylophaga frappieri]